MRQLVGRALRWGIGALVVLTPSAAPARTPALTHVSESTGLRGTGETFNFTLNESARVSFRVAHRRSGRIVNCHCVAPTRETRGEPKCTRSVTVLRRRATGHRGRNHFAIPARTLEPGRYTLTISVTGARGHVSSRKTLTFTATI